MILFRDWELRSGDPLGRQYDHMSRRLDVEGFLPEGWSWAMLVQINGAMDIIPLEKTETGVGTVLTREQLAFSGTYRMQLRGTKGDAVRHTNTISVFVPKSISGDGQWPKVPSEFTQIEQSILASAQQVREDADRAEDAAKAVDDALGEAAWVGFEMNEAGELVAVLSPGVNTDFELDENGILEVVLNG